MKEILSALAAVGLCDCSMPLEPRPIEFNTRSPEEWAALDREREAKRQARKERRKAKKP